MEKSSEVSVKEQVKKLVDLQKIDLEVYNYKQELKERPLFLEHLKQAFEAKKVKLKSLEDKLKVIQVDRKSKELDLQQKENDIAKANAQLSQIKTNKEYTAKLTEIEHIKADKSIAEEKILISYDQADAVSREVESEKAIVNEEEKKYFTQKKEIDESLRQIQEKVRLLENTRNQLTPGINPEFLRQYERILDNKEGLAIVPVNGSTCGGCFMNVPAQIINEIKMHDKLISCGMCARFLYLEEDI